MSIFKKLDKFNIDITSLRNGLNFLNINISKFEKLDIEISDELSKTFLAIANLSPKSSKEEQKVYRQKINQLFFENNI